MKLKGLGRGLDALLADNDAQSREQQRTLPVGISSRASISRVRAWTALRSKNWRPRSGCRD
jgi:hypothetical protein